MSADTVLGPENEMTSRFGESLAWAMDTDEVAALLESNGVNDSVAGRDFGHPTVFELARSVRNQATTPAPTITPVRVRLPLTETLYRSLLYLTPMIVAISAARELHGIGTLATIGPLICGWGVSQGMTFIGYEALGTAGRGTAARALAAGFAVAAAAWSVVLLATGSFDPRDHLVSAAQFALFAATGAALVTRTERRVLAAATGCWVAAAALAAGGGHWALDGLLLALLVLLLVAYLPAATRRGPTTARTWWPSRQRCVTATWYAAVGAGQAVLFIQVALRHTGLTGLPVQMLPLLICVPAIELLLVWHLRRVADGRASLTNLADFRHHLGRVSHGTVTVLAVPLVVGMLLAAAADGAAAAARAGTATGADVPAPGLLPGLAESVLLTAVFALCLVLAAHRRLAMAVVIVWWPALLVTMVQASAGSAALLPPDAHRVIDVGLAVAGLLGLITAARAARDPRSYQ